MAQKAQPVITNDPNNNPPVQETDPEAGKEYTSVHHPSDVD